MATNLTPEQLQQFTNYLTPETLNQIYGGLAESNLPGGFRPNLGYEWDSTEAMVSGGPGRATLTGYSGPIGPDNMYNEYSPTGEFLGRYEASDDSLNALLPILMAVGGQFLFGGGFGGAGASAADIAAMADVGMGTGTSALTAADIAAMGNVGMGAGAGAGTTAITAGLPATITKLLTNPSVVSSLLGVTLAGGSGGGGGTGMFSGSGSIPTQGMPTNSPEYFNQVQGFLNQYLPGQMPNQAQYLQNWYGTGATMPSGGGVFPNISVLQQVGLMPKTSVSPIPLRPTTPLPPPPPPPPPPATGVSLEDIRAYLGARPGLTDAEIAAAMDQYGVTAAQMSAATGVPFTEVLNRYQEATGRVAFPAGMFSTPGIVLSPSDYARPTDSGGGGGVSTQQIVDFLEANPGMSDAAIASAMDQYGVTASQMSAATGVPLAEVMERYEAATGRPAFPAGMFSL